MKYNLFHGSSKPDILQLRVSFSTDKNPFGKAVYLTEDKEIANLYAKGDGVVYSVLVEGGEDNTINLDKKVGEHSPKIVELIKKLNIKLGFDIDTDFLEKNSRNAIHPAINFRDDANNYIQESGVWMIFGELHEMEKSGRLDQGIQYAVINENNMKIQRKLNAKDIFNQ